MQAANDAADTNVDMGFGKGGKTLYLDGSSVGLHGQVAIGTSKPSGKFDVNEWTQWSGGKGSINSGSNTINTTADFSGGGASDSMTGTHIMLNDFESIIVSTTANTITLEDVYNGTAVTTKNIYVAKSALVVNNGVTYIEELSTPAIVTGGYQPNGASSDAFELQASYGTKQTYSKIVTFDQPTAGGVLNFHLVFPYNQGNGGLQYKLTIVGGRHTGYVTGTSSNAWITLNQGAVIDESYHYWEEDGDYGNNSSRRYNMIEAASGQLILGEVTHYLADSVIATSQGSEGGSELWDYAIVRYPITLPGVDADYGQGGTPQGKFAVHLEVYDGLKPIPKHLPPQFLCVG